MADNEINGSIPVVYGIQGNLYRPPDNVITGGIAHPGFGVSGTMRSTEEHPGLLFTMPKLAIAWEGTDSELGDLTVDLPTMTVLMDSTIAEFGYLSVAKTGLSAYLDAQISEIGDLIVDLPGLAVTLSTMADEYGDLLFSLPVLEVALDGRISEIADLIVELPATTIALSGVPNHFGDLAFTLPALEVALTCTADEFLNMVMNLRNQALTEYQDYEFNSMCWFDGKPLASDGAHIYDLSTGDDDDGVLIDWNFRTGFLDLERSTKKKLRQAWVGMKTDGEIVCTAVLPDGTAYVYTAKSYEATETGVRIKFGKGIRTKYVALDFASDEGASLELDVIRLHLDQFPLQR